MAALEEREYRSVCKKLAVNEERSKLLNDMRKNKVCLAYEEGFILHTTNKFKALRRKGDIQKSREEFIMLSLKLKIRDNNFEDGPPSLYVGESSRKVQERAIEHHDDAKKRDEKSHIWRHQKLVRCMELRNQASFSRWSQNTDLP